MRNTDKNKNTMIVVGKDKTKTMSEGKKVVPAKKEVAKKTAKKEKKKKEKQTLRQFLEENNISCELLVSSEEFYSEDLSKEDREYLINEDEKYFMGSVGKKKFLYNPFKFVNNYNLVERLSDMHQYAGDYKELLDNIDGNISEDDYLSLGLGENTDKKNPTEDAIVSASDETYAKKKYRLTTEDADPFLEAVRDARKEYLKFIGRLKTKDKELLKARADGKSLKELMDYCDGSSPESVQNTLNRINKELLRNFVVYALVEKAKAEQKEQGGE